MIGSGNLAEGVHHMPCCPAEPLPACDGTRWLEEASTDFRVGTTALSERETRFAVFGCGNSLYDENFNTVAK